jgi:hypothetical protein
MLSGINSKTSQETVGEHLAGRPEAVTHVFVSVVGKLVS